jgi:hypothetical protein
MNKNYLFISSPYHTFFFVKPELYDLFSIVVTRAMVIDFPIEYNLKA